ncbi:NADH-quinone oxidoreductase subunit K [Roseomonas sp. OT10]|uniref:sodium:proton antiporter n=1 Tax=Roseomonas cutis TaxID=2897332 RepID=UPI001E6320B3|nr:NADH-quinone oxidoreductase subunit K [Roseomonas sp. OT10]UFN47924.1 NADH-quinone oxidoreductase subunit K [Roseomonas sp. OT10]
MSWLLSLAAAVFSGCGLYLLLSRNAVRIVLGLSLLSTATNLILFQTARPGTTAPPLIAEGATTLPPGAAAALPQALVLTAIVIGFALTAFLAALVLRARGIFGAVDTRVMEAALPPRDRTDGGEGPPRG